MQSDSNINPFGPVGIERAPAIMPQGLIDFAPILHRWEKYRLWYNAVLIAYTLLWCATINTDYFLDSLFWFQVCFLGGVCNLCFFTGPALEAYGKYFGMWSGFLSVVLFLLGLMFTGVMTTAFLIVRAS